MVLIGIIAAVVSQRFTGTSGYDEYVVRDQLIEAVRFAQQRAMYDHSANHCYRLNITPSAYAVQRSTNNGATFDDMHDLDVGSGDGAVAAALDKVTLPTRSLVFDGLGNSVTGCGGASAGNVTINIAGASTLALCIYATGYVRASGC